jgi:hypothetical protein
MMILDIIFKHLRVLGKVSRFPLFFFTIVVDMLAILIARANEDGQIGSLVPHLVDEGISILQYADDTIMFMEYDLAKAINMKLILCFFE